ncbi:MAG: plasmid mobilization protein [Acidobacteriota bacterium]
MQPGSTPEDLHAILGRFHTWAGKNPPPNGNGKAHANGHPVEGIREIPYEEAVRQHRERQAARTPRRNPAPRPKTPAPPQPDPPEAEENLPDWVTNLPTIPATEPVIALRAAPSSFQAATSSAPLPQTPRPTSPPKPVPAARKPRPNPPHETTAAPLPDPPARAFVDLPPAALSTRHQPQRRTPTPRAAKPAAAKTPVSPSPTVSPAKAATPSAPAPRPRPKPTPAAVRSGILQPALKGAPLLPAQPRRDPPALPSKPRPSHSKRPRFSQILATTVQQPKAALAPGKKPAPDRSRRITTRFSPSEERRIGKCAADRGITVSAYLRQCALASVVQNPPPDPPAVPARMLNRKPDRKSAPRPPAPLATYAPPAPSLFGGWLAMLRNRFLGPPIRFSEDA